MKTRKLNISNMVCSVSSNDSSSYDGQIYQLVRRIDAYNMVITVGIQIIKHKRISLSSTLKLFLVFGGCADIIVCRMASEPFRVADIRLGSHNLLAYLFVCLITLAAIIYWDSEQAITVGKLVLIFAVFGLIPLWIYRQWFNEIGPLNIWYGE